jgi:hypothetical protein
VQAESASTSSVSLFFSFPKTTHDGIVAGTLVLADEAAVLPRQHPDKVGGHLGKFRVWSDVVKASGPTTMPKRKRAWIERREDDRSIDLFDALAPADFCPCQRRTCWGGHLRILQSPA